MNALDLAVVYAWVLTALVLYMSLWFWRSVVARRTDTVDQAWGPAFLVAGVVAGVVSEGFTPTYLLVLALVAVWGGRLFWHIFRRHRATPEDPRYVEIESRGPGTLLSRYVSIYLLQGVLVALVGTGVIVFGFAAGTYEIPYTPLVALGALVWAVGFTFESVGDAQLRAFLANPANAGALMTSGLWRYTRHPNYFGEITMWWGLWLVAFNAAAPVLWIVSAIGPLAITVLIIFVSGIPPIERAMAGRADFQQYAARTSPLVPWFPKGT